MNVLDLFSGIGGFSLGLERAGMKTVAFCEIEKYPQSVLRKHWPGVPIFDDIRKLHATDLPETIDVICGGVPCQPVSVAGKRQGQKDNRWLWPEMYRLIQECNPRWVAFENVPGIINMGLDQVLSDLESAGYKTATFIIPACTINAPHRRDRVWVVAHGEGDVSDTNRERFQECDMPPVTDKQGFFARTDFKRLTTTEWITQPGICARNDGVSGRVARLKALGNSVVPQIVEIIGRAIMEIEQK